MIAALMLAAVQAATPVPPTPPAAAPGERTIIREIVLHKHEGDKSAAKDGKGDHREIIVIRSSDRAAAGNEADRRIRIVDVDGRKDGERREIRILRGPGAAGARIAMIECESGSKVDTESTGKDGKKTRVMVCAKGGEGASRVEALEKAAKRIADNKELPEDVRTRVISSLNEEIGRLKAGK